MPVRHVMTLPILALWASYAAAGPAGFDLSWDGCSTGAPSNVRCYACNGTHATPFVIQSSFYAPADFDFYALEGSLDIHFFDPQAQPVDVPDFWHFVGCATYQNILPVKKVPTSGCDGADLFPYPNYSLAIEGNDRGYPHSMQFLIDESSGVYPNPLTAGKRYAAFGLQLDADAILRLGCAGCSTSAVITLQQIEIFGTNNAGPVDVIVGTANQQGSVVWQGTPNVPCGGATPTARSSWGAIKALYR